MSVHGFQVGVEQPLFAAAPLREAYYANSYACRPADEDAVIAWSEHDGDRFAAAVRAGNAVGVLPALV